MSVNHQNAFDPASTSTPIYATQGGGYATYANGSFVWHSEIPEFLPDTKIGDPIPKEWDVLPVNDAARDSEEDLEQTEVTLGPDGRIHRYMACDW